MSTREPGIDLEPILKATNITVRYGGVTALDDVSVVVPRQSIVGLLGPNGAGKSTLLGVLSGLIPSPNSSVLLSGVDISKRPAHWRARLGLTRTFQQPELFGELTVREHFLIGHRIHNSRSRLWSDPFNPRARAWPSKEETDVIDGLVATLGLTEFENVTAGTLPLGTSRLVELGRALSLSPDLLLLDEPSSGLDAEETKRMAGVFREVVDNHQVSLILVEHDVDLVLGLSDEVCVLDFGVMIAQGKPEQIRLDPKVRAAYLGTDDAQPDGSTEPKTPRRINSNSVEGKSEPLLTLDDVSVKYGDSRALSSVSMTVPRASTVTVLGSNGAGKSTVARAVSGLIPVSGGRIRFDGEDITAYPAHEVSRLGLAHLPEGRGIFPTLSVAENFAMAVRSVPRRERSAMIEKATEAYPILRERRSQLAGSLSGGQQQMLSLACTLALSPKLIVADEISLGLAPMVVDEVFEGLNIAIAQGVSVLLIEQFVHRALAMSDWAYILRRGQLAWSGDSADARAHVVDEYIGTDLDVADSVAP
ncbi:ATP-binding cassette domain-containing protein [Rhodococcus globerulus]|uniref:ATP-binding cassette domain-containing protein n=1 Tax=Rhodococcus globerulus TaxID=33008 RepID=A0ABU4C2Y0_RHOGO|nr:ATP-binding cassette domain-containing protein [Rhodococcus globerulus]MDV6270846.1 ATP-binding cassette domain-containing protein [Rhodococcus globerulus]